MHPIKPPHSKGFTLIEVLVAILILALVIAGGVAAATAGLRSAYAAKNQVIAYYLAQDAFEYLRGMRDSISANQDWTNFVSRFDVACASDSSTCTIDTTQPYPGNIAPCVGSCYLNYNGTNYNYIGSLVTPTKIERFMTVKKNTNNGVQNELEITLTIRWKEITGTKTATFIDSLYDWR